MASTVIKNWDNKTWLSSQSYINQFNKFLVKNTKLNSESKILDIGCGRGKIIGDLNSKLKFSFKPLGIDIVNHKDKDKRINFKKICVKDFFIKNNDRFDLILIKQTIHLLSINEINILLKSIKKILRPNGKILIFTLDTKKNEIPTFKKMKLKLDQSLKRDKKILKIINKFYPYMIKKRFIYKVKIRKNNYIRMLKKRFISSLLSFSKNELLEGIKEIKVNYQNIINFNDKLICLIL